MAQRRFDKLDSFSRYFNISESDVKRLGFFDITLDFDSKLYIDSRLLNDNNAPYFSNAGTVLKNQFTRLLKLLAHAKSDSFNDMFWHQADKMMTFKELHGTCLGYSNKNIIGNAIGTELRSTILHRVWELIKEGKSDPEIFELICVFTDKFGCDRTSDLITFMIKDVIYSYNENIIKELDLGGYPKIKYDKHFLLRNPFRPKYPILLLPSSILSDLPVCFDFEDIETAVLENQEARESLQTYINFEEAYSKADVFKAMLDSEVVYTCLIDAFKAATGNSYNFEDDPKCVYKFRELFYRIKDEQGELFTDNDKLDPGNICSVADKCIAIFKHLVEDCGIRKSIYEFHENVCQNLFYACSYYYCNVNNVALCPEANSGRGPVDFFLTNGSDKVSIEFKKSSNQKYIDGLLRQLPDYMRANDSQYGYYVFLNVDSQKTKKVQKLLDAHSKMPDELKNKIKVVIIDAFPIPSASNVH